MRIIPFFLLTVIPLLSFAQNDTSLKEVVVTGIRETTRANSALNIRSYGLKQLEASAPLNLSDALSRTPGIGQLSTGNAISKPVIRGLYGHRILVLLSGLRFDNQQWQDEHGLGLSQIGLSSVEVIRGPASVLYGTDAIGGVINVIEETPSTPGLKADVNIRLHSNTLGTLTDAGVSRLKNNTWWRLRLGYESHGDYSGGSGERVLNSRNTGYYLKAGFGFQRPKWIQNNAYNFSYNQFGFILPDLTNYFKPDERWSRGFKGPHHNVMFNTFSSQNTFLLASSVLKVNAGVQSNKRAEDEGGGEISLDMHLLSFLESARWEKALSRATQLIIGQQFSHELNDNLGKRRLVPDASMSEANLSAFLHFDLGKLIVEAGGGLNYKQVVAKRTTGVNDGSTFLPDNTIRPFDKSRAAGNAVIGFSCHPVAGVNIKSNVSSGSRMANLAELSSNGLHEGVYRYEIGNPDFKMEQNICSDLTVEVNRKVWSLDVSAYYNRFYNYIFLAPTNLLFQGLYYEYRFEQQDARLYGGELTATLTPASILTVKERFSMTEGLLDRAPEPGASRRLPFIPAYKAVSSVRFERDLGRRLRNCYLEPELEYVLPQNHPAMFETATPDYALVHIYAGCELQTPGRDWRLGLSFRNLLDKEYRDHLSRLKYYGINNQGFNFVLFLSTQLTR